MSEANDKPLVLFHDQCQDGFGAAWIAWRTFGTDADYVPVLYDQPPPDVHGRPVYILDFSYSRLATMEMIQQAQSLVIIDHHKTAEAELANLACDQRGTPSGIITPQIVFDMSKSGARLAWEFFETDDPPFLISLVQDRDLWRFELPKSRELNAWLSSMPHDFDEWDMIAASLTRPLRSGQIVGMRYEDAYTNRAIMQGEAILRVQERHVERICREAGHLTIGGYTVPAANTPIHQSEVAGKLAEGMPFGCAYYIRGDGMTVYSLRSRKDGLDVSEVAAKYPGGGGHREAAGFQLAGGVTPASVLVQPTQTELAS